MGNTSVFLIASLKMSQAMPFLGSPLDLPLLSAHCFSTVNSQREILIVHLSCACLCNLMTVFLSCIKADIFMIIKVMAAHMHKSVFFVALFPKCISFPIFLYSECHSRCTMVERATAVANGLILVDWDGSNIPCPH